jgi:hypothetical protein
VSRDDYTLTVTHLSADNVRGAEQMFNQTRHLHVTIRDELDSLLDVCVLKSCWVKQNFFTVIYAVTSHTVKHLDKWIHLKLYFPIP